MKHFTLQILAFLFLLTSQAQNPVPIQNEHLNQLISNLKDSLNIPGISVGIAHQGQVLYLKSFGNSSLFPETPLSENAVWPICSVSKHFVSVACQLLVQERKLNLDYQIAFYLKGIPASWKGITVRQLLTHTSGIKDYIGKDLYGKEWEEVIVALSNDTLDFVSGTKWNYSNTGFWIAAKIVEKITNLSYDQYLKTNFFNPLKLKNTKCIESWNATRNKVEGYYYENDCCMVSQFELNSFKGRGDGDIISTIGDLLKWEIALAQFKILNKQTFQDLLQPSIYNIGDTIRLSIPHSENAGYSMGWFNKEFGDTQIFWTPGSLDGYSTSAQYIPDYDLHIIVFCNKGEFLLADRIGFEILQKLLCKTSKNCGSDQIGLSN
jgi:CubicO group peptidase (beta-lactamase class C family)